jgi:hypothetical protein
MLDDPEKRQKWDECGRRREPVAKMPSGLFIDNSPIPEEKTVANRRGYLLKKTEWTVDGHQEFHDFYYERLKYDFRGEWDAKHNGPPATE